MRHTAVTVANIQELIRAYETGEGRGWYGENVSSKWNLEGAFKFKIIIFFSINQFNKITPNITQLYETRR